MFLHLMKIYPMPWGFAGFGMHFITLVGWSLLIGAAYMLVRDFVTRGKRRSSEATEAIRRKLDI